jgi:hypothetical protein
MQGVIFFLFSVCFDILWEKLFRHHLEDAALMKTLLSFSPKNVKAIMVAIADTHEAWLEPQTQP